MDDDKDRAAASYLFAFFAALLSGAAWFDRDWLGFPDGHLTDWDRAYGQVLAVYGTLSAAAVVGFLITGWTQQRTWMWRLLIALGLITVMAAAFITWGLDGLDHGQGG